MKQRLHLARTLVDDPPVLTIDKSASGLDPRTRLEMKAFLTGLKGMGKMILVSSHIVPELADFCNKIGIIERGKLLPAGCIIKDMQRQLRTHGVLKVRVLDEHSGGATALLRDDHGIRSAEVFNHSLTGEFEVQEDDLAALLSKLVG